jgi:IS4 transposase
VSGIHPSVNAAYKALEKQVGVSKPALYAKLNGLEPNISEALVQYAYAELSPLVSAFALSEPALLPGYVIRIADGNHLSASEHRLKPLRQTRSGPLPGHSIAVLDPAQQLVTQVFLCEDAHAQERSLLPELLETVQAGEVWIADRNFCTRAALMGIAQRQAYFVIRAHQNLPWQALAPLKPAGASATGEIFEQPVTITHEGKSLILRRIVVKLLAPTRHGDSEVIIFTNLPATVASAAKVAELYRERWSVEKLFQVITDVFSCELNSLGYPRAALFVFCVALVAFNILATVKTALKAVHGIGKVEAGLSDFYLVEDVQATFRGMMIALPEPLWCPFAQMSVESFAQALKQWAAKVDLKRFSASPRGPKKPPKKDMFDPKHPHVSTARILNQKQNKRSP